MTGGRWAAARSRRRHPILPSDDPAITLVVVKTSHPPRAGALLQRTVPDVDSDSKNLAALAADDAPD